MECIKTIDTRFDGSLPNFISAFIRARDISEEDKKRIMKEFDVKE